MRITKTLTLILCAATTIALQCSAASAADPVHTRLFENEGQTFYRAPSLVITTKGTLIAACNSCDGPPTIATTYSKVVARRSTNGGKTWGAIQTILDVKSRPMQVGAGIVDPSTGEIMFFCTAWPQLNDAKANDVSEEHMIQSRTTSRPSISRWGNAQPPKGWRENPDAPQGSKPGTHAIDNYSGYGILRSKDDGKTWTFEKIDIEIPKDDVEGHALYTLVITGGSDTGIVIRKGPHKGRLLVPVCAGTNQRALYNFLHPRMMRVPWTYTTPYAYCATTIYSDDHGKTWQVGGFGSPMAAESCVAELPDGSIYLNAAASGGWRAECRSKDSGATWGQFALSYLRDGHSGCAGSMVSVPSKAGNRACLVLTAPAHNESGFDSQRDRKKFTANVSFDAGKTWPVKKLINEGPSGYSVSVRGKDGTLFVLYEKGDNVYYDQGVSIAKFNMKWLLDGK